MIDKAGDPETINYLYLGDYVDRGIYGLEVVLILFAKKLVYPTWVVLLWGNHESQNMTTHFTFWDEVIEKYDIEVYKEIITSFNSMPISVIADNKYICMHGGISRELKKIEDISKIDRFVEPPLKGLLCDLLWADPCDDKDAPKIEFGENKERECSIIFGKKPT